MEFPLHIDIEAPSLSAQDTAQLVRLTQRTLDDHDSSPVHHLRIGAAGQLSVQAALTVSLHEDTAQTEATSALRAYAPVLDVKHPPFPAAPQAWSLTSLAKFISQQLRDVYAEEQATLTHLLSSAGQKMSNNRVDPAYAAALDQRSTRAFKFAPQYHLTFSLFSASATPSSWDIKPAVDEYLTPILSSFSSITTFSVNSQVQLHASLSPSMHGPIFDEQSSRWTLEKSDLGAFVNAAEWPLSPSVGAGPTINFVLYLPSERQSPLVIHDTGGTSWIIPQWGGVQILNSKRGAKGSNDTLTKDDLKPVMRTFADQLVSLLGLPQSPASLPLQLSSLTRERAAARILSASSTLGALARLTLKLTSIAIPNNVADSVRSTLHHLSSACTDLHEARYESALHNACIAEAEAEEAFFEPSMVGQVYFPDEHKATIYAPLLGPISVPLLTAALKELKKWRSRV